MSDEDDLARILVEDIDEEILSKMPDWFKILREAYEEYIANVHTYGSKQGKKRIV